MKNKKLNCKELNNNCINEENLEKNKEKKSAYSRGSKIQVSNKSITTPVDQPQKKSTNKTFNESSFYAKNNIELDENNNLVYKYKDVEDYKEKNTSRKRKLVSGNFDELVSTNIAKKFELLSKELMYSEQFSQKGTDSDDSSTYIDIEKA